MLDWFSRLSINIWSCSMARNRQNETNELALVDETKIGALIDLMKCERIDTNMRNFTSFALCPVGRWNDRTVDAMLWFSSQFICKLQCSFWWRKSDDKRLLRLRISIDLRFWRYEKKRKRKEINENIHRPNVKLIDMTTTTSKTTKTTYNRTEKIKGNERLFYAICAVIHCTSRDVYFVVFVATAIVENDVQIMCSAPCNAEKWERNEPNERTSKIKEKM